MGATSIVRFGIASGVAVVSAGWSHASAAPPSGVHPGLTPNLVASYDFEHPAPGNAALEEDQGFSGTALELVNGGAA
ncbi:MAG TPA: hypothetical protein VE549_01495, partial [Myxococcaceae bacterium]|nr:hypothetical protein [Myxococcaceae bacterium]